MSKNKLSKLESLQHRRHLRVGAKPDSPWQKDDRKWFARNPKRGYRMRPTFEGEWPEELPLMLVRRLGKGSREKLALGTVGTAHEFDSASLFGTTGLVDTALAMMWVQIQTGKIVMLDELMALARAIDSGTHH
jgi:hypothetical protein